MQFKKEQRLLKPRQFSYVFDKADYRASRGCLLLLARKQPEKDRGCARLGLIVAKKHLKKAVDRNRIKRCSREQFRRQALSLAGLDIIMLLRGRPSDRDWDSLSANLAGLFARLEQLTSA